MHVFEQLHHVISYGMTIKSNTITLKQGYSLRAVLFFVGFHDTKKVTLCKSQINYEFLLFVRVTQKRVGINMTHELSDALLFVGITIVLI